MGAGTHLRTVGSAKEPDQSRAGAHLDVDGLRELPVTANGKLSRAVFRDWILEGDARVRPLG